MAEHLQSSFINERETVGGNQINAGLKPPKTYRFRLELIKKSYISSKSLNPICLACCFAVPVRIGTPSP